MFNIIIGILIIAASTVGVMACRARNGEARPFMTKPVLSWAIPVGLLSGFAAGLALTISGGAEYF